MGDPFNPFGNTATDPSSNPTVADNMENEAAAVKKGEMDADAAEAAGESS
jgi:hypothetical protein